MTNNTDSLPLGLALVNDKVQVQLFVRGATYYVKDIVSGLFEFFSPLSQVDTIKLFEWGAKHFPGKSITKRAQVMGDTPPIRVLPTFPKIPYLDFLRLIKTYHVFCKNNGGYALEVGTLGFYNPNDLSFGTRLAIPTQKVTGVHWAWDADATDSVIYFLDASLNKENNTPWTLDELTEAGFVNNFTSHSHNTMGTTWSSNDVKYQAGEEGKILPPKVHFLLGNFRNYSNLEELPEFEVLASVNTCFSTLIDIPIEQVLEISQSQIEEATSLYASLDWIGESVIQKVATTRVTTPYYPSKTKTGFYYSSVYPYTLQGEYADFYGLPELKIPYRPGSTVKKTQTNEELVVKSNLYERNTNSWKYTFENNLEVLFHEDLSLVSLPANTYVYNALPSSSMSAQDLINKVETYLGSASAISKKYMLEQLVELAMVYADDDQAVELVEKVQSFFETPLIVNDIVEDVTLLDLEL